MHIRIKLNAIRTVINRIYTNYDTFLIIMSSHISPCRSVWKLCTSNDMSEKILHVFAIPIASLCICEWCLKYDSRSAAVIFLRVERRTICDGKLRILHTNMHSRMTCMNSVRDHRHGRAAAHADDFVDMPVFGQHVVHEVKRFIQQRFRLFLKLPPRVAGMEY